MGMGPGGARLVLHGHSWLRGMNDSDTLFLGIAEEVLAGREGIGATWLTPTLAGVGAWHFSEVMGLETRPLIVVAAARLSDGDQSAVSPGSYLDVQSMPAAITMRLGNVIVGLEGPRISFFTRSLHRGQAVGPRFGVAMD